MKNSTHSTIILLLIVFCFEANKVIAQTPTYSWSFESTGANIGTSNEAIQSYCTPGPSLYWGCEGHFGRGCICCFRNITTDFPGGLPNYLGVGVRRNTDTISYYRMFLAAGIPTYPGNYTIWSNSVTLYQGQNYLFKCYVKNLNRSHSEGQPSARLQFTYLDGPQKGIVQQVTEYQPVVSNHNEYKWDSIQGAWHNTSNCHVKLEVAAFSPDGFSNICDTFGYMLGIDSITLTAVCGLNTPTTWCANDSLTLRANISGDPTLDTIRWYVNNVLKFTRHRDSTYSGITYAPNWFRYSFSSANPATKIKIVRRFLRGTGTEAIDSCISYINVLPAVSANFTVAQTYLRQIEMTNTSVSATSYTWRFGSVGGYTYNYTTNPTFIIPGTGTSDSVKLTATGSCGSSTSSQNITLCNWSTRLSFDTSSTNLAVTYKAHGFYNSAHTSRRYFWSFGDGTYSAANDSDSTATHTYAVRGNYRVSLVETRLGCGIDTSSKTMLLCETPPLFTRSSDSICNSDSIHVTCPYSSAPSYAWYVNGELMSTSQSTYLKVFSDSTNIIKLVINNGCKVETFYKNVFVSPSVVSAFKFSTTFPTLSLTSLFVHGSSYSWVIKNVSNTTVATSSLKNYSTSSLSAGTYTVYLTVVYKGCTMTTSKSVCLQQDIRDCCAGCSTSN